MARGRMVNKKISNSKRVNDLPLPAQLLYTWLIAHLDCQGVFFGAPQMVRSLVFPRKTYTARQVEQYLTAMENAKNDAGVPLIFRWSVDGETYLFMPGFEGEQVGLRTDKEHPEYPLVPSSFRQVSVKNTEGVRKNVGVREVEENRSIREDIKENIKEKSTQPQKITGAEKPVFVLPDWIKQENWSAFTEMRKKLRAPLTDRAAQLVISELEKLRSAGNDPNEVLNQSTMNSYKGVFALKGGNGAKNRGNSPANVSGARMRVET